MSDFHPKSTLYIGDGAAPLADALRALGVDTSSAARGSDPLDGNYDLIICIDGRLPGDGDAGAMIANLCTVTDAIVFRPSQTAGVAAESWIGIFARHGFYRDLDYDASSIASGAWLVRRLPSPSTVVAAYERALHAAEGEVARGEQRLSATHSVLVDTERRLREHAAVAARFERIQTSPAWRLAKRLNRVAKRVAPPGTRRRRILKGVAIAMDRGPKAVLAHRRTAKNQPLDRRVFHEYQEWLAVHDPTPGLLKGMRHEVAAWTDRPLLSIVMPTYKPDLSWFSDAIDSVTNQVYDNWELCVADDSSNRPDVCELLDRRHTTDARVKVVYRETNGGIVAASQSALALATGEFVVLMDHDDILRPQALYALAKHLYDHPDDDVIYSDEDKLMVDGSRDAPCFKPDWSPEMLLAWNYVGHVTAIRRSVLEAAGGFRAGFDGSQDHDLYLRVTERARGVGHIPDVLYSWRQVPGSVALDEHAKPYARDAGLRAVRAALERRGVNATVEHATQAGLYDVHYRIEGQPRVTIVIPTRDRLDLLRGCIDSIKRLSTYPNYEIVVIDNDSRDPAMLDYLATSGYQVVQHAGPFNYSRIINRGVSETDGDYILTLNNDIQVTTPGWIEALLELGQRPRVGAVGGRLLFPDLRVQHEGIGIGLGHIVGNMAYDKRVIREVSAVTGACMLIPRGAYDAVGGFDESLGIAFNDVDFCLRLRAAGFTILYTPRAELIHHESASRGRLDPVADHRVFCDRWGEAEDLVDPFVGPHLTMVSPLSIRMPSHRRVNDAASTDQ